MVAVTGFLRYWLETHFTPAVVTPVLQKLRIVAGETLVTIMKILISFHTLLMSAYVTALFLIAVVIARMTVYVALIEHYKGDGPELAIR